MTSKIKRMLLTAMSAALLLAGCGDNPSRKSESQLYEKEFDTSKYDSYITYHIDDEISEADFEKVGGSDGQLMKRFQKCFAASNYDHPTLGYQIQSNPKDREIKIYFNNDLGVTEELLRLSAEKNLVEMREGTKPDGKLVLGNEQIKNAVVVIRGDRNSETAFWNAMGMSEYARDTSSSDESENTREQVLINLELNEDGTKKIKEATEKLVGKNSELTIWVDGKTVYSPKIYETINTKNMSISGLNIDYKAAKKIAYQLRSGHIPYKISVTECKVSPPKNTGDSSDYPA